MFGMDAPIQYFEDMGQFWLTDADFTKFSTPDWRDEVEVVERRPRPPGRPPHHHARPAARSPTRPTGNRMTTWITEYLIKRRRGHRAHREVHARAEARPGPVARGLRRGRRRGHPARLRLGRPGRLLAARLLPHGHPGPDPADLRRAPAGSTSSWRSCSRRSCASSRSMTGARFDLIETGGGAASSTVISPDAPPRVLPALRPEDARRPARARLQDRLPHLRRDDGHRGAHRRQRLRRLRDAGPRLDRREPGAVGVQSEDRPAPGPDRRAGPVQRPDRRARRRRSGPRSASCSRRSATTAATSSPAATTSSRRRRRTCGSTPKPPAPASISRQYLPNAPEPFRRARRRSRPSSRAKDNRGSAKRCSRLRAS